MPHSSRGALTPGLFWHQPGALATRSPRVLAKDTKDCFWPHSTACRTSQDQGSNPCPLQEVRRVLTTGPLGKSRTAAILTMSLSLGRSTCRGSYGDRIHIQRFLQSPTEEPPAFLGWIHSRVMVYVTKSM